MARLISSPSGGTPLNAFEQLVLETFRRQLPRDYQLLPNFILKPSAHQNALELDILVMATHAIYVVECKEWFGRITGDDTEWLLNNRHPKSWPMNMTEYKAKVLKSFLRGAGQKFRVEPAFVVPDGTRVQLTGGWSGHCNPLTQAVAFLKDASKIGVRNADIRSQHQTFIKQIQGSWGKRIRGPRKKVGGYDLLEPLYQKQQEEGLTTYLARRSLISDPNPYRIRVWTFSSQLPEEERKERLNVIRRPTEAVAQIGSHPHLLRILQFDELPNEPGFFEVTEWSEFGTLHGYLRNSSRPQLTTRERLEIAAGIANALVAIHGRGVIHRNICPETILIGFDLQPRLTDFDRAYLKRGSAATVFGATKPRNPAYVPPELSNPDDYDFSSTSDMYCFGILLFELLTGAVPFQDSTEAISKGGCPTKLPSDAQGNIPQEIDQLVLDLLRVDDFNARPVAQEVLSILNQALRGTTSASLPEADVESTQEPEPLSFEEGKLLAENYKIEGKIGEGSFSTVYKVQQIVQGKYYAMKVLKDQDQAEVMFNEFGTGELLPQHPNIAAIRWLNRLPPPDNTPYILSEYVDGEKLKDYCEGTKVLPLSEVKRIAIALLDALDSIHPQTERIQELQNKTCTEDEGLELDRLRKSGILHRDIKPDNILLDNRNIPKLIDFNISAVAEQAVGRGGTPRYWAPDRGKPAWAPTDDLFSLGVVLYELVTHRHPYANNAPGNGKPFDPRKIAPECGISKKFADFLHKAVQPSRKKRFLKAAEMRAALEKIPSLHAQVSATANADDFENLTLTDDEKGRKNYNPYVTRLLTLYSQAKRSNAGTRGLDEIARLTYVDTKLDTELGPAILDGKFRLVIVTGNAGDGKTAFLQQLEAQFKQRGADLLSLESGNGAEWTYNNIHYASNYDGSQDEGDLESDKVLAKFLDPFTGKSLAGLAGPKARIIAINEGRLLDFLDHSSLRSNFTGLQKAVRQFFTQGIDPPDGLLIVNLNLRSVAAGATQSLVERQLLKLLQPKIWVPCEACSLKNRCPIKVNADSLRDPASGSAVRARIRRLFEVLHLRRQQHITMRDLRSVLSYLLLQDHSCENIAQLLSSEDANSQLIDLYYTEAFADKETQSSKPANSSEDRVIRLLKELDVGQVDTPDLDRRLAFDANTAVPWLVFEDRSSYLNQVYTTFQKKAPGVADTDDLVTVLHAQRKLIRVLRRKAYFERRDEYWRSMLPYQSLNLLEQVTLHETPDGTGEDYDQLKDCIVEAISLLEGVRHPLIRKKYVCLRASQVRNASARSFRLFPQSYFTLKIEDLSGISPYLELAPDAVVLKSTEEIGAETASLRISLDLLEMLDMVRHGYRPSPGDMGGLFVNLVIFRNELLHLPYVSVLVTEDDERFYQISADTSESGQVALIVEPRDIETIGEML
ncbi:hypothetical protein D0962_18075 [Leptolyngbyaceae cyanobacterium CCMR0082]|uniref:Uncharacterized protein n=1 Tax=Adonisia turfae CCMR0082 TaxID=2304604 RepID=A0A6M0SAE9_9CYAN|nr:serine/threonine protein kinase [Adonisia turfae]NEZ64672.1 hypothetical protein [Adonisia turfae CCMR0082]